MRRGFYLCERKRASRKFEVIHWKKRQVLPILLEAASLYALALGCEFVRLINPALGLLSRYERYGYVFGKEIGGRVYCEIRVSGGVYASS